MKNKKLSLKDLLILLESAPQPDSAGQDSAVQPTCPAEPESPRDWDGKWALWPDGEVHVVFYCHVRERYRFRSGVQELYSTEIPPGVRLFPPSYQSVVEILGWNPGFKYERSSDWVYRDGQPYVKAETVDPLLLEYVPYRRWPDNRSDDVGEVGIGAGDGLFGTLW